MAIKTIIFFFFAFKLFMMIWILNKWLQNDPSETPSGKYLKNSWINRMWVNTASSPPAKTKDSN